MKYNEDLNDHFIPNKQYDKECNKPCPKYKRGGSDCSKECEFCKSCDKDICINNNPIIKISVNGSNGGTELPEPYLSSYIEALGRSQTIPSNSSIVFDNDSIDSVGNNIELDASGTIFTINRTGLYHVEWNLNLARNTTSAVVGILENGEPASGSATVIGGNFSSGTLIHVDTVPFTLSLHNYNGGITIEDINPYENSAASIRITRFADGPSE